MFRRVDLDSVQEIWASVEHVVTQTKGVVLGVWDQDRGELLTVETVEHVLAALAGMGFWNAVVEVDGPELPAGDGSAKHVVDALQAYRWRTRAAEQPVPVTIAQPLVYARQGEGVKVLVLPCDGFKLSYAIDREDTLVGWQDVSLDLNPATVTEELAPARTFLFTQELPAQQKRGRYLGASEATALLVDPTGVRNREARFGGFYQEMVRHKALDALGDFWGLLGRPIRGHLIVIGGGHRDHLKVTSRLHRILQWREGQPIASGELGTLGGHEVTTLIRQLKRMGLCDEADVVRALVRRA